MDEELGFALVPTKPSGLIWYITKIVGGSQLALFFILIVSAV